MGGPTLDVWSEGPLHVVRAFEHVRLLWPARHPVKGQVMPGEKPNVLLIMADDVGWFDVGVYHHRLMGCPTRTGPR